MPDDLTPLLNSRKTEDRLRAVARLASRGDVESQKLLLAALKDKVNYVATAAAEALGQGASDETASEMLDCFQWLMEDGPKRDVGCHIRSHLAFAFGRLEYRPAGDPLLVGIKTVQIEAVGGVAFDVAAHLRANCALALAQIGVWDSVRDIALLLFDNITIGPFPRPHADPMTKIEPRKAAAQALARLGNSAGLLPLAIKLKYFHKPDDEVPEVLQECMQAVVDLEDERAMELLTPYLQNSDETLAAYAALMIAQTRDPDAAALLKATALTTRGNALRSILLSLSTLRTEAATTAIHALAASGRDDIRLATIEILADWPDAESQALLEKMATGDSSANVRRAAKNAAQE